MGVDLKLIAINNEQRECWVFQLERRSSAWSYVREIPPVPVPDEVFSYEFCEWTFVRPARGSKKAPMTWRKTKAATIGRVDCYDKVLQAVVASELIALLSREEFHASWSDFADFRARVKESWLVILYWH